MTTSHSARDRPRRSESLGSPPPPSPRRRSGEGSRNRRVPSPIPESEERVTVETNPSPPNRHPEGDRDLDSTPGGKQGPRLHARRDGPLEHGRRGLGTRRPASHTRRARTGQAPECLCRTEPRKRRGSPLGDTGRLRREAQQGLRQEATQGHRLAAGRVSGTHAARASPRRRRRRLPPPQAG